MNDLFDFEILKFTGKVGLATVVNSVSFKSVDTATYLDDRDSLNYPTFEPYLTDKSYSYETWIKFKLRLNDNFKENINSRGLTIKKEDNGFCYNVTYTKIKNICFWLKSGVSSKAKIKVGSNPSYVRPVDSASSFAVEDINNYYNSEGVFSNIIKYPIYFNGLNEININQLDEAICDDFYVWQLELLKGLQYQLDPSLVNLQFHYEIF